MYPNLHKRLGRPSLKKSFNSMSIRNNMDFRTHFTTHTPENNHSVLNRRWSNRNSSLPRQPLGVDDDIGPNDTLMDKDE